MPNEGDLELATEAFIAALNSNEISDVKRAIVDLNRRLESRQQGGDDEGGFSSGVASVHHYVERSPLCSELLAVLDRQNDEVNVGLLQLLASILETPFEQSVRTLHSRRSLATAVLNKHLKTVYRCIGTFREGLHFHSLRLLTAIVTLHPSLAAQVVRDFNFGYAPFQKLSEASRQGGSPRTRQQYIRFAMALLECSDQQVVSAALKVKNFINRIFQGLAQDPIETVHWVLQVVRRRVLLNAHLPRLTKVFFFNAYVLHHLAYLLQACLNDHEDALADDVRDFLVELCSKSRIYSSREHDFLLDFVLKLKPYAPQQQDVATALLESHPDLYPAFFASLQLTLSSRSAAQWITGATFLSRVLQAGPRIPFSPTATGVATPQAPQEHEAAEPEQDDLLKLTQELRVTPFVDDGPNLFDDAEEAADPFTTSPEHNPLAGVFDAIDRPSAEASQEVLSSLLDIVCPPVLSKTTLTHGLLATDRAVVMTTCHLLMLVCRRLAAVCEAVEKDQPRGNDDHTKGARVERIRRLQFEVKCRLPEINTLLNVRSGATQLDGMAKESGKEGKRDAAMEHDEDDELMIHVAGTDLMEGSGKTATKRDEDRDKTEAIARAWQYFVEHTSGHGAPPSPQDLSVVISAAEFFCRWSDTARCYCTSLPTTLLECRFDWSKVLTETESWHVELSIEEQTRVSMSAMTLVEVALGGSTRLAASQKLTKAHVSLMTGLLDRWRSGDAALAELQTFAGPMLKSLLDSTEVFESSLFDEAYAWLLELSRPTHSRTPAYFLAVLRLVTSNPSTFVPVMKDNDVQMTDGEGDMREAMPSIFTVGYLRQLSASFIAKQWTAPAGAEGSDIADVARSVCRVILHLVDLRPSLVPSLARCIRQWGKWRDVAEVKRQFTEHQDHDADMDDENQGPLEQLRAALLDVLSAGGDANGSSAVLEEMLQDAVRVKKRKKAKAGNVSASLSHLAASLPLDRPMVDLLAILEKKVEALTTIPRRPMDEALSEALQGTSHALSAAASSFDSFHREKDVPLVVACVDRLLSMSMWKELCEAAAPTTKSSSNQVTKDVDEDVVNMSVEAAAALCCTADERGRVWLMEVVCGLITLRKAGSDAPSAQGECMLGQPLCDLLKDCGPAAPWLATKWAACVAAAGLLDESCLLAHHPDCDTVMWEWVGRHREAVRVYILDYWINHTPLSDELVLALNHPVKVMLQELVRPYMVGPVIRDLVRRAPQAATNLGGGGIESPWHVEALMFRPKSVDNLIGQPEELTVEPGLFGVLVDMMARSHEFREGAAARVEGTRDTPELKHMQSGTRLAIALLTIPCRHRFPTAFGWMAPKGAKRVARQILDILTRHGNVRAVPFVSRVVVPLLAYLDTPGSPESKILRALRTIAEDQQEPTELTRCLVDTITEERVGRLATGEPTAKTIRTRVHELALRLRDTSSAEADDAHKLDKINRWLQLILSTVARFPDHCTGAEDDAPDSETLTSVLTACASSCWELANHRLRRIQDERQDGKAALPIELRVFSALLMLHGLYNHTSGMGLLERAEVKATSLLSSSSVRTLVRRAGGAPPLAEMVEVLLPAVLCLPTGSSIADLCPGLFRECASAYTASTSPRDRTIRRLLMAHVDTSGPLSWCGQLLDWRDREAEGAEDEPVWCDWLQLDAGRLRRTLDDFPFGRQLREPPTTASTFRQFRQPGSNKGSDSDTYDVAYVIPYLAGRLRAAYAHLQQRSKKAGGEGSAPFFAALDEGGAWLRRVAAGGALQMLLMAAGCMDASIRICAYEGLAVYSELLDKSADAAEARHAQQPKKVREGEQLKPPALRYAFKELPSIRWFLTALRNAIPPPANQDGRGGGAPGHPPVLGGIVVSFCAAAVPVLLHPEHHLFPVINNFMLSRSHMDLTDVPLFYGLLYSESLETSRAEKMWIAKVIRRGSTQLSWPSIQEGCSDRAGIDEPAADATDTDEQHGDEDGAVPEAPSVADVTSGGHGLQLLHRRHVLPSIMSLLTLSPCIDFPLWLEGIQCLKATVTVKQEALLDGSAEPGAVRVAHLFIKDYGGLQWISSQAEDTASTAERAQRTFQAATGLRHLTSLCHALLQSALLPVGESAGKSVDASDKARRRLLGPCGQAGESGYGQLESEEGVRLLCDMLQMITSIGLSWLRVLAVHTNARAEMNKETGRGDNIAASKQTAAGLLHNCLWVVCWASERLLELSRGGERDEQSAPIELPQSYHTRRHLIGNGLGDAIAAVGALGGSSQDQRSLEDKLLLWKTLPSDMQLMTDVLTHMYGSCVRVHTAIGDAVLKVGLVEGELRPDESEAVGDDAPLALEAWQPVERDVRVALGLLAHDLREGVCLKGELPKWGRGVLPAGAADDMRECMCLAEKRKGDGRNSF
ncbi:unnamed protein product [Vitrella brassicaformis CCMP3155]|uniref:Uncharacterized protein n=3 Tax=Vitrella brassicaformis TaxID=1169539 RepID=A0A0G4G5E2_VITBC|nr:unnamed protein product [Vitrella brassicaformis CCMP3155]|eukprot:CEM23455.1 unnamed protein product [Vitrella brassicaformis CCMP3155]